MHSRIRPALHTWLIALVAAAGLTFGVAAAGPAGAAGNPYQRGPAPTAQSLTANAGPYQTAQVTARNVSGFGGATIYYPTSTAEGSFGIVSITSGFVSSWSQISWLGPRLASHGFVVVGVDTYSPFDFPSVRGDEALAALDNAIKDTRVANRIDPGRQAVAGWSMGGGGALNAAARRPGLKAIIPIAPWEILSNWSSVKVPTLVIAGEGDAVAPEASNAEPFYNTVNAEKAYLEINNGNHFFTTTANATQGAYMVSWLKLFVDNDQRYLQFVCPGPAPSSTVNEYRSTCPR